MQLGFFGGIPLFWNYVVGSVLIVCGTSLVLVRAWLSAQADTARFASSRRKDAILAATNLSKKDKSNAVVFGFFHPYCNAGGGGERVLWTCVRDLLAEHKSSLCVIYTGDTETPSQEIIRKAKEWFGTNFDEKRVLIQYLRKRRYVAPETWPRVTLLGQSLGSIPLGYEAVTSFAPDIFVDTMGYAFTYPLIYYMLGIPIAAYVHFPTISSDMLKRLSMSNVGKQLYWRAFAKIYGFCGRYADIVMTNSTWTSRHIAQLWKTNSIVYPPCDTKALSSLPLANREKLIVMVAQFRKEKNHEDVLRAMKIVSERDSDATLKLVGTIRDQRDQDRVERLRMLCKEFGIESRVEFLTNVPWRDVVKLYGTASIGINAMVDEHFGIGVVEYQAAGLIAVVHNSAGPRLDIVVSYDGKPTGYHATTGQEFAEGLLKALQDDHTEMRERARKNAQRFSEEEFSKQWLKFVQQLFILHNKRKASAQFQKS